MSRTRSNSGSTISDDTRTISDDEEYKIEHPRPGYSTGGKAPRLLETPFRYNDRSPKRRKITDTVFDGELPNHMIEAAITCAEKAIQNEKKHILDYLEECYREACLHFEEKREGRVQELESVINTDQMSEWLQGSDWKDRDIASRLRKIKLPSLWSATLATDQTDLFT
ncbi:hypothetical protein F4821DRAFT_250361 [Hypoxylon rubiginosum]|uniref:Uncharacterized protein n=1 Tax=Hypoxylon rubiginosum TaxID=110542 RepID=A0ACC0CKW2_9PEZI|nr:hypothetical protein F4821DRAFT_250361 [Hypoxylon rubiginosum]